MMDASVRTICPLLLAVLLWLSANGDARAGQDARFTCGGEVEAKAWALWDDRMRNRMQRLLQDRLVKKGDAYALYDFQTDIHNLVSMARRCRRNDRLAEISRVIRIAYGELEPAAVGRQWVCRGGGTCSAKNGHLGNEVKLNSAQFLGVASAVATALASSGAPLDAETKRFIKDTTKIVSEHLERWGEDAYVKELEKLRRARPEDVKNGSSALGFKDYHAWQIALYAELAGLLRWQAASGVAAARDSDRSKAPRMRRHLQALLRLFTARISFRRSDPDSRIPNTRLADLDRGYWALYADNRYAGYESEVKPSDCTGWAGGAAKSIPDVSLPAASVPKRTDTGWDISHARRLVHAFDALERNRGALKSIFSVDAGDLGADATTRAFAATLIVRIWNQDTSKPLFSNYWSGANGWYRVGYNNGTDRCVEGYGPYGLTSAFLTGGYIAWARYYPLINVLGRRMYDLSSSEEGQKSGFIARYYPQLASSSDNDKRDLTKLMFLPSLVGIADNRIGRR